MGQAKIRRQQAASLLGSVLPVAQMAASAMRKLAIAASTHVGSDCYAHAKIAQILLADLGIKTRTVAGYAAWRVGSGDSDVIAHVRSATGFLPAGSLGFPYHVWLETISDEGAPPILIDVTAYQLPQKARDLDAADGGNTEVSWTPDLVVLRREDLRSYKEVATAFATGLSYYEEVPGIMEHLDAAGSVDQEDVDMARLILASPGVDVIGPNHARDRPA